MPLNRKLVLALVFVVAPFLFLWDFLLFHRVFWYFDFEVQWIPFHQFAHAAVVKGESLLWNPYIMLGFPQHGESQLGAFYPLNLLLHWLPNQPYAISLSLYLHLILGLISTYLLARAFKLQTVPAVHAAFCFAFSGFVFAQFTNYNITLAAAYLPLKLLLITWYFDRAKAAYLMYFALASAAELLISHANMSFITSITAGLYFLILACMRNRFVWRDPGLYTLFSLLAVLLAAIQLLPTLEFVAWSERAAGVSYDTATSYSHSFSQYLTAFFPLMFGAYSLEYTGGSFEEFNFFIGSFGILPAVFGILIFLKRRDNRFIGILGLVGLCALILSLGMNIPLVDLYQWIIKLPGFSFFRCPARWSLVLTLALAIFSGYGLQVLGEYLQTKQRVRAVGLIVAIAVIAPLLLYALGWQDEHTDRSLLPEQILYPLQADLSSLTQIDQYLYAVFTHLSPLTYFLLVTLALVLIVLSSYRLPVKYCIMLIASLGLLDLLLVNKPINPSMPSDFYQQKPYHISYLQRYAGIDRAVSSEDVPNLMSVNNSVGAFYGVQSTEGYAALKLNNYIMLMEHMSDEEMRDYVGVKYEIRELEHTGYEAHPRPGVFPRAFLLEHYRIEHDDWTAFNEFVDMDRSARKTSVALAATSAGLLNLNRHQASAYSDGEAEIRPAQVVAYRHDRIEIEGETQKPAFLLLTDMYYPGWQARVNGELVPVVPLNGVFRGVHIEKAGPFRLEFEYRPRPFKFGAWLSFAALLLIMVCGILVPFMYREEYTYRSRRFG